jgi:tRNA/tmRNA/rRNA uracil-C5-methylase (TrmA/RlmC/RlmD family)
MKYKKKQFEELFARVGSFKGFKLDEAISSKDHYNYRSHITLHKTGDKYGFYTRDERSIMEIASCSIAEEAINGALPAAAKADDKDRLTIKADHAGRLWSSNKMGERFFPDTYAGKEMMFSPLAFSQANRHISVEMARVLGEWIGPERADTVFFDIFSGIGFFSFLLAPGFAKTIGADNDRVAISAAKTTAKEKGYEGMKFYILDAENEMERLYNSEKGKKNIALIDPPRKGLPAEFVEWLSFAEGLDEIYYISCDPARMARRAARTGASASRLCSICSHGRSISKRWSSWRDKLIISARVWKSARVHGLWYVQPLQQLVHPCTQLNPCTIQSPCTNLNISLPITRFSDNILFPKADTGMRSTIT